MIVLSGMHRSGTTYLGEVLAQSEGMAVWHEPFNRRYGLADVGYDYVAGDFGEASRVENLVRQVQDFGSLRFAKAFPGDSLKKKLGRAVIGGKTERQWRLMRAKAVLGNKPRLVLKDPFLSLSSKVIAQQLSIPTVVIVRHPCAVWLSIRDMDWDLDTSYFAGPGFMQEHWRGYDAQADMLETFCRLWKTINQHNYELGQQHLPNFYTLTHEDLCRQPVDEFKKVFEFLAVPYTEGVDSYVAATTQGTLVDKTSGKQHEFVRDASALVDRWRSRIDPAEEAVIRKFCGDLVETIYGAW